MDDLLKFPGAVAETGRDAPIPAHFGDPMKEQRILVERVGVVDRSDKGIVRVSGSDRLSWLHSLTTQHVEKLEVHRSVEALILTTHGHIEHHLVMHDDGENTWIVTEPGYAATLVEYLQKMRFMLDVEVADESAEWAHLVVCGSTTADRLREAKLAFPSSDNGDVAPLPGGGWVRRRPWPSPESADIIIPRSVYDATLEALMQLTVVPCGNIALEALRVEARRPQLGYEIDHRTLVHEVGFIPSAVHLNKGCYRGQETVAKVQNMGKPPRRMVLLHLDGMDDELPSSGDEVRSGERTVGFIGTAVRHYELGPIASALIKRSVLDDAALEVHTARGASRAAIDTPL